MLQTSSLSFMVSNQNALSFYHFLSSSYAMVCTRSHFKPHHSLYILIGARSYKNIPTQKNHTIKIKKQEKRPQTKERKTPMLKLPTKNTHT
jgi:hypothetical protein